MSVLRFEYLPAQSALYSDRKRNNGNKNPQSPSKKEFSDAG